MPLLNVTDPAPPAHIPHIISTLRAIDLTTSPRGQTRTEIKSAVASPKKKPTAVDESEIFEVPEVDVDIVTGVRGDWVKRGR